ncbi:MAG: hypothetical protein P8188_17000, partial [Gemmatimonadota bacterium]
MIRRIALGSALLAALVGYPPSLDAQQASASGTRERLRVFLDCATWNCREDRFRQEITWVTWVREPQDADVNILLTGQRAGSGGFQYTFDYEGRGEIEAARDRLTFTS